MKKRLFDAGIRELYYDIDTDTLHAPNLSGAIVGVSGIPTIGSSTDNAVVRWNGTGGNAVQNSNVIVDDDGNLTISFGGTSGPNINLISTDTGGKHWRIISTGSADPTGAGFFQIYNVTDSDPAFTISSGGNVGFGTDAPNSRLMVNGAVSFDPASTSTSTTLTDSQYVIYVTDTSAVRTITLPSTSSIGGRKYLIADRSGNASVNNITIVPDGSNTIADGVRYVIRDDYGAVELQADATTGNNNWSVINEYAPKYKIFPLQASTGWTTRNGSGTAAITSNVARFTLATSAVPGAWANVPMVSRAHHVDPWDVDIMARIASLTGGNSANVYVAFGIRRGSSGNEGVFINLRGDGGSMDLYGETIPSSGIQASAGSVLRSTIDSGQFWLRIAVRGAQIVAWYGSGASGVEPTEWIMIGQVTNAANHRSSYLANVVMTLDAVSSGSSDDVTLDFDNVKITKG